MKTFKISGERNIEKSKNYENIEKTMEALYNVSNWDKVRIITGEKT